MSAELLPFGLIERCRKCDSESLSRSFITNDESRSGYRHLAADRRCEARGEHLDGKCRNCGWRWSEACADSEIAAVGL